jgi:hypothetical protein
MLMKEAPKGRDAGRIAPEWGHELKQRPETTCTGAAYCFMEIDTE